MDQSVPPSRAEQFRRAAVHVLSESKVIDLIPQTTKQIVLDSGLQVQHAYSVLSSHGYKCGAVWDSKRERYAGMLSISDFVEVLVNTWRQYKKAKEVASERAASGDAAAEEEVDLNIPKQRIVEWQQEFKDRGTSIPILLTVPPQASLLTLQRQLLASRVHRLAVSTDPLGSNIVGLVSQHQLLGHLLARCVLQSDKFVLSATLGDCAVIREGKLFTICSDTPALEAAEILLKNKIGSLPIVEGSWFERETRDGRGTTTVSEGGRVRALGLFSRADVLGVSQLGVGESIRTQVPVSSLVSLPSEAFCRKEELLTDTCKTLFLLDRHQLVCVDQNQHIVGVVALIEIFSFILQWELTVIRDTSTQWATQQPSSSST